jgi:hypothetical protein
MSIVRVKNGVQATTFDHANQTFVTLTPGAEFDSSDPFVKENAWAFETDAQAERDPDRRSRARTTSVSVEDASATPGTKRNR